jgi:hypothetical protein
MLSVIVRSSSSLALRAAPLGHIVQQDHTSDTLAAGVLDGPKVTLQPHRLLIRRCCLPFRGRVLAVESAMDVPRLHQPARWRDQFEETVIERIRRGPAVELRRPQAPEPDDALRIDHDDRIADMGK